MSATLLPVAEVALAYSVKRATIHLWVRTGKLPAENARRRRPGGRQYLVDPERVAALVLDLRRRAEAQACKPKRPSRPKCVPRNVCRAGLEPDAVEDARSACDAVAGTLQERGLVLTPADYAGLARRRELFEKRKAVSRAA